MPVKLRLPSYLFYIIGPCTKDVSESVAHPIVGYLVCSSACYLGLRVGYDAALISRLLMIDLQEVRRKELRMLLNLEIVLSIILGSRFCSWKG